MMINKILIALAAISISGHAAADDSVPLPALNAADALQQISSIAPGEYSEIELLPGKDGRWVYFAMAHGAEKPLITVIDSNTGNNLSDVYTQPKHSLQDALRLAVNDYAGTVISAYTEIHPDTGIAYFITIVRKMMRPKLRPW